MIQEQYVSFEVAKLLKEKGFECISESVYVTSKKLDRKVHLMDTLRNYNDGQILDVISAPTQSLAMRWLREVHYL